LTIPLPLTIQVRKLVNKLDATLLRSILAAYYCTVQRAVNNAAPKAIMHFLVHGTQDGVYARLFERIAQHQPAQILDEPPELEAKRRADLEVVAKLRAARTALEALTAGAAR
tara:strand:+ start:491 stop:826 length:336 start_codon:yes stop_codon:yes gene_type:complete